MILKIKSLIYRLTGIFLAHKEELEYIRSDKFWKEYKRISKRNKDKDISGQNLQGLLIGLWQMKHKFYRKSRIR